MKCKITGDKLSPFMSFGKMPSANGFLDKKDLHEKKEIDNYSLIPLRKFTNHQYDAVQ